MVTRHPRPGLPRTEIRQFTSPAEIDRAIAKLRSRIKDIESLNPVQIRPNDQRVHNVEAGIRDTILEVFGENSPEYGRNRNFYFGHNAQRAAYSDEERQEIFSQGIPDGMSLLDGLIKTLEEKRADLVDDPVGRVRTTLEGLDLHPRIAMVSVGLFQDGHYRNAVLDGSLALVNFVKEKSRCHEMDGADLMRKVFSKKNPILAFNELKDQSELDEQEGLMHLFEGAVLALRNPRAHELTPDSPKEALEYIVLLSFLSKQVDRAKRRNVE